MQFVKENYPLLAFVVVYIISKNLLLAAGAWTAGSLVQIMHSLISKKPISKMHIFTFILGGLLMLSASYFKDDNLIKWKTSIVLWIGAAIILFRQLYSKKYLINDLIQNTDQIHNSAPENLLKKINLIWILFFITFGFINLYVAYNFSTDFWFYFKIIGLFASSLLLMIGSFIALSEHLEFEGETTDTASSPENEEQS